MPVVRTKYLPEKEGAYCDHDCNLGNETAKECRDHVAMNQDHIIGVVFEFYHTYQWEEPQGSQDKASQQ